MNKFTTRLLQWTLRIRVFLKPFFTKWKQVSPALRTTEARSPIT